MTLIKCPDCHKSVSDQAERCPNCGHPVNVESNSRDDRNKDDNASHGEKIWSVLREQFGWRFILVCLLMIFLMALAFVVLCRGLIGIFGV